MIDLNKYYLRNTHLDDVYRREMDKVWDKIPSGFSGVAHLLDSAKPMNIADILSEAHGYAHDWPLENNSEIETNPNILEEVLALLVNFDMIKIASDPI